MKRFQAALIAVALVAGRAQAGEPLEMPSYAPGDAFVYSDGRVEQVRGVEGEVITWSGLQGAPYQRRRNFIIPVIGWSLREGQGRRIASERADALWPLAPGRSARFSIVTETRRDAASPWERSLSLWVCKVGAGRDVDTPAGRFLALPIACDRFSPGNMRLLERVVWDYSPDVGHYVRRTTTNYLAARTTTIALASQLHGRAATRARLLTLSGLATRTSAPQP